MIDHPLARISIPTQVLKNELALAYRQILNVKIKKVTNEDIINNIKRTVSDISESWAKEAIEVLASRKIISGMGGGLFNPAENVKRVTFSILMNNILAKRPEIYSMIFSDVKDVPEQRYFAGHIISLNNYGILDVRGGTAIEPAIFGVYTNQPNVLKDITRAEAATFIVNGYNYIKIFRTDLSLVRATPIDYTDVDPINSTFSDNIKTVTSLGIMRGYPDGTFRPNKTITREEAAQVMVQFLFNTDSMIKFHDHTPDVS